MKGGRIRIIIAVLAVLAVLCCIAVAIGSRPREEGDSISADTETPESVACGSTATSQPTSTSRPTTTQGPTNTPRATSTPRPTATPVPPTSTPNPNLVAPGTYLVATDIQPGLYKGQAGYDIFDSCYWERLSDLSGSFDSILANDNTMGQFYVEIKATDHAFKTDCWVTFLSTMPASPAQFPQTIPQGTYIIGVDIAPGTYRGQAGTDILESCYWERLSAVSGDFSSVIANDNATGQFYVGVQPTDFALSTACSLERVGD
jgi:hypothetical protein